VQYEYDCGEKSFQEQLHYNPFIPNRIYKNFITAYLSAKLLKTNLLELELIFTKDKLLGYSKIFV